MNKLSFKHAAVAAIGLAAMPAFAHPGVHHLTMSMAAGFAHPFSGLDHVLAFAAIGLWSAQHRGRAVWLLPLLFLAAMTFGALVGMIGVRVPGMEAGIAASVAVLGLLIAFALRLPLAASSALVSIFALLHGYAHGVELPQQMPAFSYVAGFVMATGLLHLAGLGVALVVGRHAGGTRLAGAGIAATGLYLLAAAV